VVKQFDVRPHRRRAWTVQLHSLGCANVHPNLINASLAHLSPHPNRHIDRFSRFCTAHARESLYFTMGCSFSHPFSPLPLCMGDLNPNLIHSSLGPPESITQMASRSIQPFCRAYDCDTLTDRQTNRPRYSTL